MSVIRFLAIGVLLCALLAPFSAARADCTLTSSGETRPAGTVIYNKTYDVFQSCKASGQWQALHPVPPTAPCALDGATILHGAAQLFYNTQIHANCASVSLSRTCTNGVLDGDAAYQYANCNIPAQDTTPNNFVFTHQTNINVNITVQSNSVTISGITGNVSVSISGPDNPQFRIAGGSWVTSGTITNNQTLQLQLKSASAYNTKRTATITVGTVSVTWDVTTKNAEACETQTLPGTLCSDGSFYVGTLSGIRLYAAPADESGKKLWKNNNSDSPGTHSDTDGFANTYAMNNTSHAAARSCATKAPAGTWYLPALDELNVIWTHKDYIGLASKGFNVSGEYYWTSTSADASSVWRRRLSDGTRYYDTRVESLLVRCMRR